jgi:GNAT superfamily N-acetyltransferase
MRRTLDQLEFVDLRDARNDALLQAFYTDLYVPAFPILTEQEDPTVWAPRLWGPPGRLELHILVAGHHLAEPARWVLAGGVAFELYRESWCGLITYLVVAPALRQNGLGRVLVTRAIRMLDESAAKADGQLRAVFAETNDPALVSAACDSMDPSRRVEALRRLGGRIVSMQYVQPELTPGQGRSRELMLLAFPIDGSPVDAIDAGCVIAFLEDFYRTNGLAEPRQDAEFQAMIRSIGGPNVAFVDDLARRP